MNKSRKIKFKGFKKREVMADFNGGKITSDAGMILLREVEKKSKIIKRMSACIQDTLEQNKVLHSIEELMKQRVYAIAAGYEDGNDHKELRKDELFKLLCEKEPDDEEVLSSPSTISRFENRVVRKELFEMSKILVDDFIESYKTAPKEIILDFDASDNPVHGEQENRFFHGYYNEYCFLPLFVFCGEKLLVSYLRPAWFGAAHHTWAILKLLVQRIRKSWPSVKIIFRGDAGFCRHQMFNWCEHHNVEYIVAIGKNKRIEKLAENIIAESEAKYKQTNEKVREFGEIKYAAESWKKERRVIIKAERLEDKMNIRCIATNNKELSAQELYDKEYIPRGDMENRIKEHQLFLFSLRTSCHEFAANMFRVMLSSIAYVLFEKFRSIGLKNTEYAKAQCSTIRTKFIKIAALIVSNSRKIIFKIASHFPYQELFRQICVNLN
jgi:hypothetical protein